MKVYKDDRGQHDLTLQIERLELKVRTYQELIKDSKALKFKITMIYIKDGIFHGQRRFVRSLQR